MVRVVSSIPDHSVVKQVVCRHCGITLEYVPNDVKEDHGKDYSGGAYQQEWVDCPQCSKKAIIRSW